MSKPTPASQPSMPKPKTYAQAVASVVQAMRNCQTRIDFATSDSEVEWARTWYDRHEQVLEFLMTEAPSGSGFNSGTRIVIEQSSDAKLAFYTSFHHMSEHGYYTGVTDHKVLARASFVYGTEITVSGRNHNDIKPYIADVFSCWLDMEAPDTYALYEKWAPKPSQTDTNPNPNPAV